MYLKGKKVLFMGPQFYNYHKEIANELKEFGAIVDFYPEKVNTVLYRFVSNYAKFFQSYCINRYLNNILVHLRSGYDYFFLIRGEIITIEFLEKLKSLNPNIQLIMYQWDSMRFTPNYPKIMWMFDKVMTFDMIDAKELNIEYQPLFYINSYANLKLNETREYDLVFFGSFHSDRLEIIKEIDKECERLGLKFFYYLYSPKLALLRKIFNFSIKISDVKYFKTSSLSSEEVLNFYRMSKSVLDIESTQQNGLTIRTFEVLAAGIKLITTNENLLQEEFLNKDNIYILKRKNIYLEKEFFSTGFSFDNNIKKNNLKSWLLNVLKIEDGSVHNSISIG